MNWVGVVISSEAIARNCQSRFCVDSISLQKHRILVHLHDLFRTISWDTIKYQIWKTKDSSASLRPILEIGIFLWKRKSADGMRPKLLQLFNSPPSSFEHSLGGPCVRLLFKLCCANAAPLPIALNPLNPANVD